MLILTRKRDDSIKIGDDIVLRVMRTARGSVKIGIEAPASVRIVRGELNEFEEFAVSQPEVASTVSPSDAAHKVMAQSDEVTSLEEAGIQSSECETDDDLMFDGLPCMGQDLDLELDLELAMVMQH